MIENKGIYFGADIVGLGWGSTDTKLVCDSLGKNSPYSVLCEVNSNNAVVCGNNGQFSHAYIQDLGEKGVRILQLESPNPILALDMIHIIKVGTQYAAIRPTTSVGITFNTESPRVADSSVYDLRYPPDLPKSQS